MPTITQCCKCKRIRINGNWLHKPAFLSPTIPCTHSYCPVCLEEALAEIDNTPVEQLHMATADAGR
jgi:hypothetical protein